MDILDDVEEYELFGYPHTEMKDCDFLEAVFSTFGHGVHDILDIACGTGRHALEMAGRGYAVTGIDISENMLNAAKKKAFDQKLQINFIRGDMMELDFKDDFDAAYMLFTAIILTRNEDLTKLFDGVRSCLREGGLFIIEVGNLWSYIAQGNFHNESHITDQGPKAGIKRRLNAKMTIGPYNNIYCHDIHIQYWRNGEELQPKTVLTNKRIFSVNEFDLLCRLTKFKIAEVFGSTDIDARIEDPNRIQEIEKPYRGFVFVLGKE